MIEIQLKTLEVQNFKTFVKNTVVTLDEPGVTFLWGSNRLYPRLETNGMGKSSLLDAIVWCLKGRTLRGLQGADIRARHARGTTQVCLGVIVDGQTHEIRRTVSPNKLLLDGKVVGQDVVDQLIPLSTPVLANTVIFGQERPLFFDVKPREKMELLSEVLDLGRWDARAAVAAREATVAQRTLTEAVNRVRRIEDELSQTKVWIKQTKTDFDDWSSNSAQKLAETNEQLSEIRRQLSVKVELRDNADLAYDNAATEQRALRNEVYRLREEVEKARVSNKKCPECGQPVADQKQIQKLTKLCAKAERDLGNFDKVVDEYNEVLMRIAPQVSLLEERERNLAEQARSFDTATNPYGQQLAELRGRERSFYSELDTLEAKINQAEKREKYASYWAKEGFKLLKLYLIEELLQELQIVTAQILEDLGLPGWQVEYVVERETKAGTVHQGLSILINPPGGSPVKWETFSGGESRRLRVAGALALSAVLLNQAGTSVNFVALDEPTSGMSPQGIEDLCNTLADYANNNKVSVWLVDQHAIESNSFARVLNVVLEDKTNGAFIETL